jgi:hypothetical protein
MSTLEALWLTISWFVARFGLPILVTILIVQYFRWLDNRWKQEAMQRRASMGSEYALPIIRCWEIKGCPAENCQGCQAYQDQSRACWQHFRMADGRLQEGCLSCKVFLGVEAPAIGD